MQLCTKAMETWSKYFLDVIGQNSSNIFKTISDWLKKKIVIVKRYICFYFLQKTLLEEGRKITCFLFFAHTIISSKAHVGSVFF